MPAVLVKVPGNRIKLIQIIRREINLPSGPPEIIEAG